MFCVHRCSVLSSAALRRSMNAHLIKPFTTVNGPTTGDSGSTNTNESASFGFTDVPRDSKTPLVGEVFRRVASSYDVMNDFMSAGVHRLWKHSFVSMIHPHPSLQCLDVAGGTGDIAFRLIESLRQMHLQTSITYRHTNPRVVVCDINPSMLRVGKERASEYGYLQNSDIKLEFAEANAEALPFNDETFDVYTIAFGLRNVTDTLTSLKEAHRVLKKGGRYLCLEFAPKMDVPVLQQFYSLYSFNIIPLLGELVAQDRASYQYLVESIARWKSQSELSNLMSQAGFKNVSYHNMSYGVVAIHSGYKL